MNRPGQPPQRPPSLTTSQGMPGAFRAPYPSAYGMPPGPRNPLQQQGYPGIPTNHRTTGQNMVVPTPNYMQQQRAQSTFPFNAALQHHQVQQAQQHQQQQQQSLQHTQPQQQTSNVTSNLPLHLAHNSAPSLTNAPSVSSASEAALDPNDFPALGAGLPNTNANPNNSNSPAATTLTSTYATQAGTGLLNQGGSSGGQGVGSGATNLQTRELTADDFPALGGQSQTNQPFQQSTESSHPPGLNGFMQDDHHGQHRANTLSSIQGGLHSQQNQGQPQTQQQPPGMLNLGSQRNVHQGFQSDTEKRLGMFQNGVPAHGHQQNHLQQPHLNGPPGVPPPSSFQQPHGATHQTIPAQQQSQQYGGNGTLPSDAPHPTQTPANGPNAVPQTAAQQVLISPADRWGLLGLLAMIKSADPDQTLLSIGTDLGTMGLDMQQHENLSSTFMTPWSDSSAAHMVEPDFHLPACYNVHPPPPGPTKAAAFSDETLFFMFYSSPRDALQEVAAQELHNRNWRYHKELRLWLTKEAGTRLSQKIEGGEQGLYTYWDLESWEKQRKELAVLYTDLEEKAGPVFVGPTIQQNTQQNQQVLPPIQQAQAGPRGNFQGIGIAAGI